MARPIKAGVDYFPHDTDAASRKTIFTLESIFGNDGYAFWFSCWKRSAHKRIIL